MEDNLLASILRTNEKIQEYLNDDLEIILANRPVKKDDKNNAEGTEGKRREQDNKRQMHDDSLIDERYIVSIIGAKQRKSESTMAKQFYIVYEISVTRIADGHTKSVFRRFRDIRTFYYDLLQADEEIAAPSDLVFPEYTEGWFGSAQTDPDSDIVQRRKSDLQAFFFQLFRHFPILFHHMRVVEFLELKSFPPKPNSTYSMHYAKKSDVNIELSEELVSDYVYNVKTGRLENTKQQEQERAKNVKNPSCVEFLSHAEKFGRKKDIAVQ